MIRRLRALVILSSLWAVAWALLGAFVGVYQYYRTPSLALFDARLWASPLCAVVIWSAKSWGIGGAISGALFGIALALAERGGSVAHLKLAKVTLCGVMGSLLIPGVLIVAELFKYQVELWSVAVYLATIGIAGGLSAAVTLVIARRAPAVTLTHAAA